MFLRNKSFCPFAEVNSAHQSSCDYQKSISSSQKHKKPLGRSDLNTPQDAQTKKEQNTASTSFRSRSLHFCGHNDSNHIHLGGDDGVEQT